VNEERREATPVENEERRQATPVVNEERQEATPVQDNEPHAATPQATPDPAPPAHAADTPHAAIASDLESIARGQHGS
jgi:type II secretory pathway component HofQ